MLLEPHQGSLTTWYIYSLCCPPSLENCPWPYRIPLAPETYHTHPPQVRLSLMSEELRAGETMKDQLALRWGQLWGISQAPELPWDQAKAQSS